MSMGRVEAMLFAKEGAKVVENDVGVVMGEETVTLIKAESGEACFYQADVAKAREVEKMMKFVVKTYGKLDILLNNAGMPSANA
jgi:NAD(P)-dependent dehydrogenase (short-subunit alcohol dehydrogenase family)